MSDITAAKVKEIADTCRYSVQPSQSLLDIILSLARGGYYDYRVVGCLTPQNVNWLRLRGFRVEEGGKVDVYRAPFDVHTIYWT